MSNRVRHSPDYFRLDRFVPNKVKLAANAAHGSEVGDQKSEISESQVWLDRHEPTWHLMLQSFEIIMQIRSAKDLIVYQKAYALAMDIFKVSKRFPAEGKYSLIDQIRRSSRSVCTNLREAWAKRRYEAHFVSKLTDADGENAETETWLDFACDCGCLLKPEHAKLVEKCHEVGAMLGSMIQNPSSFIPKSLSASG